MLNRSRVALTTFLVGAALFFPGLSFASDSCHEVLDSAALIPSIFETPWFIRSQRSSLFQEDLRYFHQSFAGLDVSTSHAELLSLENSQYELVGQWNYSAETRELQIIIVDFVLKRGGESMEYGERAPGLSAVFTSVVSSLLVSARDVKAAKNLSSVRIMGNDIQNEALIRMFKKSGLTEDPRTRRWIFELPSSI